MSTSYFNSTRCSVPGCNEKYGKNDISMHKLPSDPKVRNMWITMCKLDGMVTKTSRICSSHFDEDNFYNYHKVARRKIRPDAVPTRNLPESYRQVYAGRGPRPRRKSTVNRWSCPDLQMGHHFEETTIKKEIMDSDQDDAMELDEETVPNAQLIVNEELSRSLSQCDLSKTLNTSEIKSESVFKHPEFVDIKTPVKTEPSQIVCKTEEDVIKPKTEVIDLVKKETKGNSKCINYECNSGVNMMSAPDFCLRYYRIKSSKRKNREVCSECFSLALLYYDDLCAAIKDDKSIFEINSDTPLRDDLVEIDDSDSEGEEEIDVKPSFEGDDLEFLKDKFDDILTKTLEKLNCTRQIDEGTEFVQKQINEMDGKMNELNETYKTLCKNLDNMQSNLYAQFKINYKPTASVDIVDDSGVTTPTRTSEVHEESDRRNLRKVKPISYSELNSSGTVKLSDNVDIPKNLPPTGKVVKLAPKIGDYYYAVRYTVMGSWTKGRLDSILPKGTMYNSLIAQQTMYCVTFDGPKQKVQKYLTGKEMAYATPADVRLDVGTRVIAMFKETSSGSDNKKLKRDAYYPGIVAEPLSSYNKYRYLIFFDDGYSQYVHHDSVFLIFEASKDVWEDMHIDSRQFIKKYLETYPERPMVKLTKDQSVRTEYNGRWWMTTVTNVDCSLVQMFFDSTGRAEWIYRGSTRLNPMFKEEQAANNRQQNKMRQTWRMNNAKENSPYVQYTRDNTDVQIVPSGSVQSRSVAKKSTAKPVNNTANAGGAVPFLPINNNNQHTVQVPPPSKIVYYTPREQLNTKAIYKSHICSPKCKDYITYNLSKLKGYNPLSKPLLCGWNRIIVKHKGKKEVVYKTPCARYIRNMHELHRYLMMTKSDMTVDLFDFDYYVRCLAEYVLEPNIVANKDLTNGIEQVPIPVVNYVDNKKLNFSHYSNRREPKGGVDLNLNSDFLCGCDCEDDCADKSKCACWQLTLQGRKYMQKDENGDLCSGYVYRRLLEPVITGIYECNSRCKCGPTCLNRVVQNPLSVKLQVFKTNNRGWGIRCLNDIPQGAFICVYVGDLLTEQMANEGGLNYGDEYLAELDYIEAVENFKEDYEADPYDEKDTRSQASGDEDDNREYRRKIPVEQLDNDFVPSNPYTTKKKIEENRSMKLRLRRRAEEQNDGEKEEKTKSKSSGGDDTVYISDDDEDPREPSSFNPKNESNLDDSKSNYRSVRRMFGEKECVYIMDAKTKGNIGRFLNHSCSPNIFVQNVFVDTHDLRFPWVAFFSLSYIRAGTELTWNYNYDIGSVPGKIMYCYCASAECKGRLL